MGNMVGTALSSLAKWVHRPGGGWCRGRLFVAPAGRLANQLRCAVVVAKQTALCVTVENVYW